ncbi:MAG TPA: GNAT family N-acetyltransferase [Dehalococcoidia bacterium]|nr:GNAT family N-acetyltransferase [Dehalococcoidia bacterium]
MDFFIRNAEEKDYEGITQIFDEIDLLHIKALPHIFTKADEPPRNKEHISNILRGGNSAIFLAESDNQIVGLIEIEIRQTPSFPLMVKRRYVYVSSIAVTAAFRGYGIGKALMTKVEQWARDKNVSQIEFNVWDFNQDALMFFQRLGYTSSRRNMFKEI